MPNIEYWIIGVVVAIALGTTAQRRLKKAAQPLRLDLAEKGEMLLSQQALPPFVREHTNYMLNSAFNDRLSLLASLLFIPFFASYLIIAPKHFLTALSAFEIHDIFLRTKHKDLMELHDKITMANHPILWLLVEIELVVCLPLALFIAAMLRGYLPGMALHDTFIGLIETKSMKHSPGGAHA